MIISQISKGSHERELALAHAQEYHKDMDTAHAQAEQKKSTDMEDEDGDTEDTVSTRDIGLSSNSSLLQKKSSYFSLEEGKNEIDFRNTLTL